MADTNTHQDLILLEKKLLERQEKLEEKQEYIKKLQDSLEKKSTEYTEKLEKIASLTRDEKLTIHIHGTFSKNDLSVIGGHVKELVISATCEVLLIPFEIKLLRAKDDMTGLNLLQ